MHPSLRVDRSNPKALRVQVVHYVRRKRVVLKHIGTAHTEKELSELKGLAAAWILGNPHQSQLFPRERKTAPRTIFSDHAFVGVLYTYCYEQLHAMCAHCGFASYNNILVDLVIMRIVEPTSKLRSLMLLEKYFNIAHTEKSLYRALKTFPALKESVEGKMVHLAKKEFGFDFSFVLYDVTTLYFETVREDALRKHGFSKDRKPEQSQIVMGLMVTGEGFPVSYEIFAGNTFEGATFLPSILAFKTRHTIETLTIVADAAMLSLDNIALLAKHRLSYIVGARLKNISPELLETIDAQLKRVDGATTRIRSPYGTLVCSYSHKRFLKDQSEMNKHIAKAKRLVESPGKVKRAKFVSSTGVVSLNEALIERTKKVLGVKGYYTNLDHVSNEVLIERYHDLWRVEQSFRVAKSDLASRPIFHRKDTSIKAHMLVCVMALAMSKYVEIKTKRSIRSVLDAWKTVIDAVLVHQSTGIKTIMRSVPSAEVSKIERLLPH